MESCWLGSCNNLSVTLQCKTRAKVVTGGRSQVTLHDMRYAIHFHSHYSTLATFFTPCPSHLIRVILLLLIRGTLQTICHGNPRLVLLHAQGYVPSPSLEWRLCCYSALMVTSFQARRMPFHCHLPFDVAALGPRVFSAALQVWVSPWCSGVSFGVFEWKISFSCCDWD